MAGEGRGAAGARDRSGPISALPKPLLLITVAWCGTHWIGTDEAALLLLLLLWLSSLLTRDLPAGAYGARRSGIHTGCSAPP